jgi:hypothetical protein
MCLHGISISNTNLIIPKAKFNSMLQLSKYYTWLVPGVCRLNDETGYPDILQALPILSISYLIFTDVQFIHFMNLTLQTK